MADCDTFHCRQSNKMFLKGVRGDYVGKYQVEIMKMRFRKLSGQFKPNYEIMDGLRLTKRTFYRYKSIIVLEDRLIWQKIMARREFW
jgi:hypothetical protein